MYIACSNLCFARLSLDETLKIIREMHFHKVDLAIQTNGPHLTPADVAKDVSRLVQKLKASNLTFSAIYLGLYDKAADPTLEHFRAICRLARLLAISTITIQPDPSRDSPGLSAKAFPDQGSSEISAEVSRLNQYLKYASAEGIQLCIETTGQGITSDPTKTVEICETIQNLGLTVDPSYFVNAMNSWEAVFPYAAHCRLRDSGKTTEEFQVRVGQGEIDFGRIVTQLERFQYDRALTIDIRDIPDSAFPIDAEVRKLKYVLESLV